MTGNPSFPFFIYEPVPLYLIAPNIHILYAITKNTIPNIGESHDRIGTASGRRITSDG